MKCFSCYVSYLSGSVSNSYSLGYKHPILQHSCRQRYGFLYLIVLFISIIARCGVSALQLLFVGQSATLDYDITTVGIFQ